MNILIEKKLRLATEKDAIDILKVYKPYIEKTSITFEIDVPKEEDFIQRVMGICQNYPFLVYEIDGKIVAYAYSNRYLERAAYGWNVQFSVYVAEEYCQNLHIGTALYTALKEISKLQNVQNVYSLVADSNEKSFAFHQKIGFNKLATYSSVGYKLGQWHDVSIFQMILGEHQNPPKPFVAIGDLPLNQVADILAECEEIIELK